MTDPMGFPFRFADQGFVARPSGALWWPDRRWLVVADLHLGRAERTARRGGALLPPWEVQDTLDRLSAEITALRPAHIIALGDNFDDDQAALALSAADKARLRDLAPGAAWTWISGNHDPAPPGRDYRGQAMAEIPGHPALRHIAQPPDYPDISGHMHPSLRLGGQRWRCFVLHPAHLILPAFGSYTGGLDLSDPAFDALAPGALAIAASPQMFNLPLAAYRRYLGSTRHKRAK